MFSNKWKKLIGHWENAQSTECIEAVNIRIILQYLVIPETLWVEYIIVAIICLKLHIDQNGQYIPLPVHFSKDCLKRKHVVLHLVSIH